MPAGNVLLPTVTGVENEMVVFSSAPVLQTSPKGTSPHHPVRPATAGLAVAGEYRSGGMRAAQGFSSSRQLK